MMFSQDTSWFKPYQESVQRQQAQARRPASYSGLPLADTGYYQRNLQNAQGSGDQQAVRQAQEQLNSASLRNTRMQRSQGFLSQALQGYDVPQGRAIDTTQGIAEGWGPGVWNKYLAAQGFQRKGAQPQQPGAAQQPQQPSALSSYFQQYAGQPNYFSGRGA